VPLLASVIAVVLVAGAAAFVIRHDNEDSGPPHPKDWDPRVFDIVHFVESARGLTFKHPVFVDFLDAKAYSDRARTDAADLTDKQKKQLESFNGELRALGLSNSNIDLLQAENDLQDVGTLAFYDPDKERVSIRGTDITVDLKVTLAHEFTHVLQDQYFNAKSARFKKFETSEESSSLRAMLEGDAIRIENEFIDSLSEADKAAYDQSHNAEVDNATAALSNVPVALQAFQSAPYLVGPPFTELLFSEGGQSLLDGAFKDPPKTDEQLIDPASFLQHQNALKVDEPKLPDGVKDEDVVDNGDFGAISLYVMLAERIDPFVAEQAIDGWGGDSYVAYEQNGKTCVRLDFTGDTSTDDDEMKAALDQWAAALPAGMATISAESGVVHLESCDPGTDAGLTLNNRANTVLQILAVRSEFTLQAARDGKLPLDQAFAFGECTVKAIGFDIFDAATKSGLTDEQHNAIEDAKASCR